MTHRTRAGMAGLLALALPLTVAAQQPDDRTQAASNAAGGPNHQQSLVLHALNQAITGSQLQLAAQFARGGRPQANPGQEADNRQERRDANQQDRAANRQDNNQERQREQQANQQLANQLEHQARQEFAASTRLLDGVKNAMQANTATNTQEGWTGRLHAAADRYADTLQALAGPRAGADRASGSAGNTEADNPNPNDPDPNARAQQRLSRGDVARVFLINHAVQQATEAFALNRQSNRQQGADAAARSDAAQRLRERARELEADSNRILQQVQAGADPQGRDEARRDQDQNPGRRDQEGRASVRELAQQAQQVIDVLQRINAGEAIGR